MSVINTRSIDNVSTDGELMVLYGTKVGYEFEFNYGQPEGNVPMC